MFDNDETRHIYLELEENISPNEMADILRTAGITVTSGRSATPMISGYTLTLAAAEGIWERESGAGEYTPQCEPACGHRQWYALSAGQQQAFMESYIGFLENRRSEELDLEDLLGDHPLFQDVTLSGGHEDQN